MKRIALTYGIITGLVVIGSIGVTMALNVSYTWLGYLIMIVAFTAIFFAVKQYRDQVLGGVIRFGTAALLGVCIAAIAGVVYVGVWETYLYVTDYKFIESYTASILEHQRARGVTGAEWEVAVREAAQMKEQYSQPLIRLPMTFLEIFPVGLLAALISAAILRTRTVRGNSTVA